MAYKAKDSQRGFTLVEMTMVIAVMGVVFLGIMVFIQYVTKGMWTIRGGMELTSKANEAIAFINQDFKNAKASSLGNIAQNPGLEEPPQLLNTPTGWETLPADVTRIGYSGTNLKSGLLSVKLTNSATYRSSQFNVPMNRPFILSSWIRNPGSMNLVRASDNSNLIAQISNTNTYWTHMSSTVVFAANQAVKLNISVPPPSWVVCTTPAPGLDKDITEVVSYKNRVYVGGWENGATFSYSGTDGRFEGSVWFGINPHVTALGVFDVDGPGPRGEELLFCGGFWDWGNATSWHQWQVFYNQGAGAWLIGWPILNEYPQWNGGPPGPDSGWGVGRHFMRCGTTHNGRLYVGSGGATALAGGPFFGDVRVYDPTVVGPPGAKWTLLFTTPDLMCTALCVYNNMLYIGTATGSGSWHLPAGVGRVYVYDIINNVMVGGGASQQNPPTYMKNMVVFNGGAGDKLYGAAANLYIYDGLSWTTNATLGSVTSVCVYNNRLYVGNAAGNVYSSTDGVNFVAEPGIGQTVRRFCVNGDGLLYSGGSNGGWGAPTVRVLLNEAHFDDISFSPELVVFDSSTVVNGVDNVYTYYTCKGKDISEYNRFRFYRLRYDTPTRKLFRETSVDYGVTWTRDGLNSDGSICDRVRRLRIINHNQESFEIELTLEIDVGGGKMKEYILRSSVTPGIS